MEQNKFTKLMDEIPKESENLHAAFAKIVQASKTTTHSLPKVYTLLESIVEAEKHASIEIQAIRERAAEYRKLAENINNILKHVGVSGLSSKCLNTSRDLTRCAVALNLKDTSETSLLLGALKQKRDLMKLKYKTETAQEKNELFRMKTLETKKDVAELRKMLPTTTENIEKRISEIAKLTEMIKFAQAKVMEYKRDTDKLQNVLYKERSMKDCLFHRNVVQLCDEVEELKERKNKLQEKLNYYENISPDFTEAKLRIEKDKKELQRLDETLFQEIKFGLNQSDHHNKTD